MNENLEDTISSLVNSEQQRRHNNAVAIGEAVVAYWATKTAYEKSSEYFSEHPIHFNKRTVLRWVIILSVIIGLMYLMNWVLVSTSG